MPAKSFGFIIDFGTGFAGELTTAAVTVDGSVLGSACFSLTS
jgi:hypothetical protein